jgi:HSP20 family protein
MGEQGGSPESAVVRFREEMNDLFDRFFRDPWGADAWEWFSGRFGHGPALDVVESDNDLTVRVDLPGIDPKDLDISVSGETLTIRGEKKQDVADEGQHWQRVERRYGSFQRSVRLPSTVDCEKVEASYKDGVLSVKVAKKEGAKPKRIDIKT